MKDVADLQPGGKLPDILYDKLSMIVYEKKIKVFVGTGYSTKNVFFVVSKLPYLNYFLSFSFVKIICSFQKMVCGFNGFNQDYCQL